MISAAERPDEGETLTHVDSESSQPRRSNLRPTLDARRIEPCKVVKTTTTRPAAADNRTTGRSKKIKWWLPSRASEAMAATRGQPRAAATWTVTFCSSWADVRRLSDRSP